MSQCQACGESNAPNARFCSNCGAPLAEAPPPQEERKLVSVLFVDLVGSTARADKADPEDVREVLALYHREAKALGVFSRHRAIWENIETRGNADVA